jgi:hypothetical protein
MPVQQRLKVLPPILASRVSPRNSNSSHFITKLESKTRTTLGLLLNNIRMANDKLLVSNRDSVRRILRTTSAEARLSSKIAGQPQKVAMDVRRVSTCMGLRFPQYSAFTLFHLYVRRDKDIENW